MRLITNINCLWSNSLSIILWPPSEARIKQLRLLRFNKISSIFICPTYFHFYAKYWERLVPSRHYSVCINAAQRYVGFSGIGPIDTRYCNHENNEHLYILTQDWSAFFIEIERDNIRFCMTTFVRLNLILTQAFVYLHSTFQFHLRTAFASRSFRSDVDVDRAHRSTSLRLVVWSLDTPCIRARAILPISNPMQQ